MQWSSFWSLGCTGCTQIAAFFLLDRKYFHQHLGIPRKELWRTISRMRYGNMCIRNWQGNKVESMMRGWGVLFFKMASTRDGKSSMIQTVGMSAVTTAFAHPLAYVKVLVQVCMHPNVFIWPKYSWCARNYLLLWWRGPII